MKFEGRKILITGATSGVGNALLNAFVGAGAQVIAVARPSPRLKALRAHGNVCTYPANLADKAGVEALMESVWADHPDLSIIINNAALQLTPAFLDDDFDLDATAGEVALNVMAPTLISALSLPHMVKNSTPSAIVNISSGLAFYPKRGSAIYCASKAALHSLSQSLRYQLSGTMVSMSEVFLPLVDTPMTAGRGSGKMTPHSAAMAIMKGLSKGRGEIYVGKARILPFLLRAAPSLVKRILKNG